MRSVDFDLGGPINYRAVLDGEKLSIYEEYYGSMRLMEEAILRENGEIRSKSYKSPLYIDSLYDTVKDLLKVGDPGKESTEKEFLSNLLYVLEKDPSSAIVIVLIKQRLEALLCV